MNKSSIEWCTHTWNPVTGCLHGCSYCYARRIAERFRPKNYMPGFARGDNLWESTIPFAAGFQPTFYQCRLREPTGRKKPATIFVCSMADLFGKWVPAEWIEAVLETVRQCPQHTFLFLTKNPERYQEFEFPGNCLLGATATDQASWDSAVDAFYGYPPGGWRITHRDRIFISAEPLLGPIETGCEMTVLSWLIIGAQTGPGDHEAAPDRAWITSLVSAAWNAHVPVFVKNNAPYPLPNRPQELPEEVNNV